MNRRILIVIIALIALLGAGYYVLNISKEGGKEAAHEHGEEKGHTDGEEHKDGDEKEHNEDEHGHGEGKGDEHGHAEGEEEHADETTISKAASDDLKIELLQVAPAMIQQTISLTGNVTLNQNKTANVKARFPGVVRSVKKNIGDVVKQGDVLATVESNESLQVYSVKSPISGVVLSRDTNVNDVAGENTMFTITDLSEVWAEFFIFQKDAAKIQPGQKVYVSSVDGEQKVETTISSLLPTAEASSQTIIARVVIPNPSGFWRSGVNLNADVVVAENAVPVAVKTVAIQRMEGAYVVFIAKGTNYSAHKVQLGSADDHYTEIKSGIEVGENYVANNSFVVKADIGKSAAEHEH